MALFRRRKTRQSDDVDEAFTEFLRNSRSHHGAAFIESAANWHGEDWSRRRDMQRHRQAAEGRYAALRSDS